MPRRHTLVATLLLALCLALSAAPRAALAADEDDDGYLSEEAAPKDEKKEKESSDEATPAKGKKAKKKRKYFTDNSPRSDAGVFHVAATVGGNFYFEPQVDANKVPTGNYFKDFGFAAGVTFDYDYSEMDENIPLCLRGMFGYKYVLNSVHVFAFDGMARRMWRFSEKSSFGIGIGGSAAVWYRAQQTNAAGTVTAAEEIIFLPSFVMEAGFDFNPFMVDIRLLINRIKGDSSIAGGELYFGFRL